ncbi:MAG: DUF3298 domain-containing protein [Muribaculaceae bacterium]|nr:DUF3298 domain-containing protein [Muribaculaceae bacterium]
MKKHSMITLLAVMTVLFLSCGSSDKSVNGGSDKSVGSYGGNDSTLCQFNNIEQTRMYQYIDPDNDTTYYEGSVTVFWPEVINGKPCPNLQTALLHAMTDSAQLTTLDQVIDYQLKPYDYDEMDTVRLKQVQAITGDDAKMSSSNILIRLQDMTKRLLTYHIGSDSYSYGAAHGIYANNFVTYDLKRDKIVTLNDIVADTTLLRNTILRAIKDTYDYDKGDLFIPDDGLLPMPSDFYIQGQVLHVVYQVYEIASYAQGMIDAPIYPYLLKPEETKRLFTPYGLELMEYLTE